MFCRCSLLIILSLILIASANEGFVKEELFARIGNLTGPTLREWPWPSYSEGPPCPPRYRQKLVPLTADDLRTTLLEIDALSSVFEQQLYDLNIPTGISVGIVYDQEELFSKGYGTIHKNKNEPPTATTLYNIGSVTKIFTSLALYHTVEAGMVSLTAPVTDFFNEENPPVFSIHNPYSSEGSSAVTLHSLASQASGLPREAFCGAYPVTKDCANNTLAAQINLEHLSDFGLLFSPFSGSHYSNLGLSLLGRSLERVWNQEYEDFMVEHIFPNIGMPNSGFEYTQTVRENLATGYVVSGPDSMEHILLLQLYCIIQNQWHGQHLLEELIHQHKI